jgi:hypothetical protein
MKKNSGADYVGIDTISAQIELSGKSNFIIRRADQPKSAPVYESDCDSCEDAVNDFINWANIILKGGKNFNLYSMQLFDDAGKNRFIYFQLSKNEYNVNPELKSSTHLPSNHPHQLNDIMAMMQLNEKIMELSRQMEEIRIRMDEDEIEGEMEEINGPAQQPSEMIQILSAIGAMISSKSGNNLNQGGGLAGPDKITRLNNAVKRLYKLDADLDADLEKLADIGEKNPGQFQFLIKTLRSM